MKQVIPLSLIQRNTGQIEGLPSNPRIIRDAKFEKLVKSIQNDPELLEHRGVLVFPLNGKYIAIGGNMRSEACKKAGMTEVTCEVLDPNTPVSKLKAFMILDNSSFGEFNWDEVSANFDLEELMNWGIDIPDITLGAEDEIQIEEDDFEVPENIEEVTTDLKLGDLIEFRKGPFCHRLLCGSSTIEADVLKLMGGRLADMVTTDPPYNVNYEGKTKDALKIENDKMTDGGFLKFLVDAFTCMRVATKAGGAFYIWHADSEGYNFRTAAKQAGMQIRQCLIWVKNSMVMGRQDYQWKHEPCQPAGTMVRTPNGEVPIETLKDGDSVVSYDKYSGQIKGMRDGLKIKTAKRDYSGEMYTVKVGEKETKTTDTHQFTIRFKKTARKVYCTYLMRKGNWWRIGITVTYDARGFGLKTRLRQEGADAAWILSTHDSQMKAQCAEQVLAVKYGIPFTHWNTDRGCDKPIRTEQMIEWIYESMDLDLMQVNARRLLELFGRRIDYPLIDKRLASVRFSCRVTARIAACNLVPEIMEIPIPYGQWDTENDKTFDWEEIESVTRAPFSGPVYSLEVDKYEHYIADGMVTHNCLYGWKEGAAHYFIDERNNTTVFEDKLEVRKMTKPELIALLEQMLGDKIATTAIHEDRPNRNAEHPTMKPVRLIARGIRNSSKPGQIVLDLFAGSGTAMVAGHQLSRQVYLMELDPRYVQVIVERMINLDPELVISINGEKINE